MKNINNKLNRNLWHLNCGCQSIIPTPVLTQLLVEMKRIDEWTDWFLRDYFKKKFI